MDGWITLHRKFQDWEWYTAPNHAFLFVHLLLKANHKSGKWRGHNYKRGDVLTSLSKLSEETGLSKQNIRTILKNLANTGEVNTLPNTKLTHLSVCKYDTYQNKDDLPNTLPNTELTQSQHSPNTVLTTNNNDNKETKKQRNKIFTPPQLHEVSQYCIERKNGIDAQKFIDHYSANGWMRGKNKIKDWKACVRTWEGNQQNQQQQTNEPQIYLS